MGGDWLPDVGDVIPEKMLVGCFYCDFEGGPCMYSLSSCRHFAFTLMLTPLVLSMKKTHGGIVQLVVTTSDAQGMV